MNCSRVFLRVMFFSIAVAISGSASAADIRYPEKGDVAFIVHLPDGWTTNPDTSGNLLLMAPDHSAALSPYGVRSKSDFEANPEAEANGILAAAKAEPFSRHEPSSIGSLKAEAYYSKADQRHGRERAGEIEHDPARAGLSRDGIDPDASIRLHPMRSKKRWMPRWPASRSSGQNNLCPGVAPALRLALAQQIPRDRAGAYTSQARRPACAAIAPSAGPNRARRRSDRDRASKAPR